MPRKASPKSAPKTTAAVQSTPLAGRRARTPRASVAAGAPPPVAEAPDKQRKHRKEKVVRDSYSMPRSDFELIALLKQRMLAAGSAVKKSELLRAGLHMLAGLAVKDALQRVGELEIVKTGRPAANSSDKGAKKHRKKK